MPSLERETQSSGSIHLFPFRKYLPAETLPSPRGLSGGARPHTPGTAPGPLQLPHQRSLRPRERPSPRLRVGRQPRHPPARRAPRDGGRLCPTTARGKRYRAKRALSVGRLLNTSGKAGSLPLAPPRGEWRVLTVRRASSESTGSARMFRSRYGSAKRERCFPHRSGLRVRRDCATRAVGPGRGGPRGHFAAPSWAALPPRGSCPPSRAQDTLKRRLLGRCGPAVLPAGRASLRPCSGGGSAGSRRCCRQLDPGTPS